MTAQSLLKKQHKTNRRQIRAPKQAKLLTVELLLQLDIQSAIARQITMVKEEGGRKDVVVAIVSSK